MQVRHETISRTVLGTAIPVYYSGSIAGFLQQNYLSELHGKAPVLASGAEHDISFLKRELKPGDPTSEYSPSELYKGVIKVNAAMLIHYGISYSVSIEQIRKFIQQNKNELERAGIGAIDWE